MSEKTYDDLLYPILCNEGNIVDFFDKIFEFLYRRTDYFKIRNANNPTLGLEVGEAEKIIRTVFCKYMELALATFRSEAGSVAETPNLDYIAEEVVTTVEPNKDATMAEPPEETIASTCDKNEDINQQSDVKIRWMDPDCYNGAQYKDYSWAQSLKDIDVRIKVPKCIASGKQVRVNVQQKSITAEMVSEDSWHVLKAGDLSWKVNVEESTWTLVPGEHIHICLQKVQERWWESLFQGDPKIDMKSIDPSIAYEDLDQESQAKISELMYNEHQKRLGKPTVQQNKIQSLLKEAWNTEGSPFKGQPFDPSIVDVQNADAL